MLVTAIYRCVSAVTSLWEFEQRSLVWCWIVTALFAAAHFTRIEALFWAPFGTSAALLVSVCTVVGCQKIAIRVEEWRAQKHTNNVA